MTTKKQKITFTIFLSAIAFGLFGLSIWQIKRLNWKNDLVSKFNQQIAKEHLALNSKKNLDIANDEYQIFTAKGRFIHQSEIYLGPRYQKKKQGFFILTPFKLADNSLILVNRGWIIKDNKSKDKRPESLSKKMQNIKIMLRKGQYQKRFIPDNDPKENFWFWLDMQGISEYLKYDFGSFYFDQMPDDNSSNSGVKAVGTDKITFRNDHLSYAITWFVLAIFAFLVILFYIRGK
jgi:surfeit locus 1 family protein